MSNGINSANVSGNLGADPELRMAAGGTAVLKMSVATKEVWFDKEEKKQERTEWHRVTVFGKPAEGLAKFLRKGMFVAVRGPLRTSSYDKEGQKHYSTEIIAAEVAVQPKNSNTSSSVDADAAPFAPFPPGPSLTNRSNGGYGKVPAAVAAADIPF